MVNDEQSPGSIEWPFVVEIGRRLNIEQQQQN
jgi:hypothetical protein